ncbi:MAG: hypothetical protein MK224_04415 [Candidatus Nitrosopelagicus sp.]|jgi:hypothetical protein|nr:hypothetical protein [Candidatus Nitrosopelagicus sp.]NWJ89855.1 hypothetical protein [Marine Group I thaumarchaeote]HIC42520.1 hypothetical protein [Pelagibacterales bacterium]|tara:strand:+ start:117 stop:515 length:399 start_codon:yes stop_codon:yes gene_type:complete
MPRILEIVLIDFNEYLKGILQQILASYKILTELNDNPSDLHTMKQEISKIIGLSLVVKNKLEGKKNQSDSFVTIYKLFSYYIETYDFSREIDILAQIYYKDSNRLKNLRLLIIDSLNDKHLIEKLQKILNEL